MSVFDKFALFLGDFTTENTVIATRKYRNTVTIPDNDYVYLILLMKRYDNIPLK